MLTDTQLIAELNSGSNHACQLFFDQYYDRTTRLAQRRLVNSNRREADEEDVAVSAFQSLFVALAAGRFPLLSSRDELWRLLATITARKAVQQTRREHRKKRGSNKVRGESVFIVDGDGHGGGIAEAAPAVAASPAHEAEVRDLIESLLASLNCDLLRKIALMRLEGRAAREIAKDMDCSTRTVERKMRRIRECWDNCQFGAVC